MSDYVTTHPSFSETRILSITRPSPKLLYYYLTSSLVATVAFPLVAIPLYFKYHTLRYRFDSEGVSMSWGILFRREINLTYKRIQAFTSRGGFWNAGSDWLRSRSRRPRAPPGPK